MSREIATTPSTSFAVRIVGRPQGGFQPDLATLPVPCPIDDPGFLDLTRLEGLDDLLAHAGRSSALTPARAGVPFSCSALQPSSRMTGRRYIEYAFIEADAHHHVARLLGQQAEVRLLGRQHRRHTLALQQLAHQVDIPCRRSAAIRPTHEGHADHCFLPPRRQDLVLCLASRRTRIGNRSLSL